MGQKGKNIVIVVTLDTKSEETLFLKEVIKGRGNNPFVIDVGIGGQVPFRPDFTREKVALATGRSLEEIRKDRYSDGLAAMAMGAKSIIENLIAKGKIDGLLAIGGSLGTSQALSTMRDLPLSLPKLILSTVAFVSGAINTEMVSVDMAMMQSVSDLWGINPITRVSLQRAAGAICGMAEEQEEKEAEGKLLVAISTLGVNTYVDRCKSLLSEKGYEPVVFHSVGIGSLEKLIRQGYFSGVLDLCCYELVNHVCGGIVKGGQDKFTAACEKGIPQVIGCGAMDFFPLFTSDPIPAELKQRIMLPHGLVNLIKTSPQEQAKIATLLAEKINKASAPTVVLVSLKGFSRLDSSKEMPFYEPGAGRRFLGVLKQKVSNPVVEIEEIDAHINDDGFAERATVLLLSKMS